MIRLDFNDKNETVLFFEPMKDDVKIRKEVSKIDVQYELCIDTSSDVCYMVYDSKEDRDAAYEYALNRINDYLFPKFETAEIGTPSTLESIF